MDKFDRIFALHTLLSQARLPVPRKKIQEQLECSRATAERILSEMRLYLSAPIVYDRTANGYYYNESEGKYQLPGLWFNAAELHALLFTHQLLGSLDPGLFQTHITPLKTKIENILARQKLAKADIAKRFRFIKIASRQVNPKHFSMVANALVVRQQLHIEYAGIDRTAKTQRDISPQRLLYYRDNWYMDAWCHLRNELRSFALERIKTCRLLETKATDIDETALNEHFTRSYGIFSGSPTNTAVVRFTGKAARWVAEEQWHPDQKGQFNLDGSYELHIPYRDPRELIMDILKYGEDAEVIKPDNLRSLAVEKLTKALGIYQK